MKVFDGRHPVIAGNRVVVGSDDGRLYLLDLRDGRSVWSYDLGGRVPGSPAVVDGRILVISEDGVVFAFGAATENR